MSSENDPIEVTLCMGSSCFARGNAENLQRLRRFALDHRGRIALRLTGSLCQSQCGHGPNLKIGNETHPGVSQQEIDALLRQLEGSAGEHGNT